MPLEDHQSQIRNVVGMFFAEVHCILSKYLGYYGCGYGQDGSSDKRGAFSRNAIKTWVEGGNLLSVCRAAPLSSLVPTRL